MVNGYERWLILSYLGRMVPHLPRKGRRRGEVRAWLEDNAELLAIDELIGNLGGADEHDEWSVGDWMALQTLIERAGGVSERPTADRLARRLGDLAETLALSSVDMNLLEALLRYETQPAVEDLFSAFNRSMLGRGGFLNVRAAWFARLLGVTSNQLETRLVTGAPLVRAGLVSVEDDGDVRALGRLGRLRMAGSDDPEREDEPAVRHLLLGDSAATDLRWSDFDHLGQARDDVARLLEGALERGDRGVNVLLYGPPGTGKTEFARVLADHVGLDLFAVGEVDEDGEEPSRRQRVSELCLAQSLVAENPRCALLVDEMEDLFSGASHEHWARIPRSRNFGRARTAGYSKVFMHRLIESAPVPTLWTTNGADAMDIALLRRMTFAVEMRLPPPRIRARIWSRQLAGHGIEATPAQALSLAREFDAPPGLAAGAVTATAISDGDIDLVRRGVRGLSRLLGRDRPTPELSTLDARWLDADIDLGVLAERVVEHGQQRFSICLQGPPGTGKSAYARYLADRLGLDVAHRRASDLMDMFVGGTERNIARAFADARADESFLVFDEADSLLADRRGAHRNWEISQVNEMLTWMEDHPLPFACTTNYSEKLDAAVLRRFTFKVTLAYAGEESARGLFRWYFGLEPPGELDRLTVLAPGDFSVVRRKAEVLGELSDPDALVEMLRAECAGKPDQRVPIGFARP